MNPTIQVVQIITAALQLAPLTLSTVQGIIRLLSQDPSVPDELKAILASTEADNLDTLARVQAWMVAHPAAPIVSINPDSIPGTPGTGGN